ncbi:hypothetical protein LV78_004117 [Actinosynnema pretiosum]|nr:hypothetical protein [Actinosynnema pretiosum]
MVALFAVGACSTANARGVEAPPTIGGKQVLDAASLQAAGESEMSYALNLGYVARVGGGGVSCWFARTGPAKSDVDPRLWCGPVQVPGTSAEADWVPIPMKRVAESADGVRLEVQPPQVPGAGNRSVPVGNLVRADGRTSVPGEVRVDSAGPDYLAVLEDDGAAPVDAVGGAVLRDDQLEVRVTGYAEPASWRTPAGELRAEHGVGLRVLRVEVERHDETDPAFDRDSWRGWRPQPSELALELPERRRVVPLDRLPEKGSALVVYTAPAGEDSGAAPALALSTVGARSLEQRIELPSGKPVGELPAALRRKAVPDRFTEVGLDVRVGGAAGKLAVIGVRMGRQRPVSADLRHELVTASGADEALVEFRLRGDGLPDSDGAALTAPMFDVRLADGSPARVVGTRGGGGVFPLAVVVEVPSDARSVVFGLKPGRKQLPRLGDVEIAPGAGVPVPLEF